MNCPYCSTSNLDNASICVNCGRALSGSGAPPPPPSPQASYTPPPPHYGATAAPPAQIPNYLWQSIVVTLCCCLPLGIVGIIFAVQVNDKLRRGDVAGAMQSSKQAKLFTMIGFIIGLIGILIYLAMFGAGLLQAIREGQLNG